MKKGIMITIATLCVIGAAAVGIFMAVSRGLFAHEEAKGLILYGSEAQLSADQELESEDTTYSYETNVKIVDENMMVIREKDMKEFCDRQIVNEIDDQDKCTPVSSIESAQNTPVYYAKEAKSTVEIDGNELEVTQGKDYIIGSGRMFDKGYLVVSDRLYEEINGNETGMLVLKLNKAADKEISSCQYEQVQLIDMP